MMNYGAFCQSSSSRVQSGSSDTICVPRADLVRKLQQIEELKVKAVELDQVKGQRDELTSLLVLRDQRILNYEQQSANYTDQIRLKDETIKSLNKSLRNQSRKTMAIGLAAILVVASVTFLHH
jgi:hypothetical protein